MSTETSTTSEQISLTWENWNRLQQGELSAAEEVQLLQTLQSGSYEDFQEFFVQHDLELLEHFLQVGSMLARYSATDHVAQSTVPESPVAPEQHAVTPVVLPVASSTKPSFWLSWMEWFRQQWMLSWAVAVGCVLMVVIWQPWNPKDDGDWFKGANPLAISPARIRVKTNHTPTSSPWTPGNPLVPGFYTFSVSYEWDNGAAYPYLFLVAHNQGKIELRRLVPGQEQLDSPVGPGRHEISLRPIRIDPQDQGSLSFVLLLAPRSLLSTPAFLASHHEKLGAFLYKIQQQLTSRLGNHLIAKELGLQVQIAHWTTHVGKK